jgi:cytochrome c oxidase subunit III
MEIPYTVRPRPDTGLVNGKLGIWLFLASEVMLFGALFSAYVLLRVGSIDWLHHGQHDLSVPVGFFNTLVLITSSITVVLAWASLKMGNFSRYKLFMGLTILLGFVFLIVKSFEYGGKFAHGIFPANHTFYAIYFTITGLHALHVIAGMSVNIYLWGPGSKMWRTEPERFTNRVEISGLFWHFVDLVWIFLFPILYLL